jgi:hypothetical protein
MDDETRLMEKLEERVQDIYNALIESEQVRASKRKKKG